MLKVISFAEGIRAEDIDYNFKEVENQIKRERLSVAGHGISSGLEISVDDFKLNITAGKIIDITGAEIELPAQSLNIALPRLNTYTEDRVVNTSSRIHVTELPYSLSAKKSAEFDSLANCGISMVDKNNAAKTVPVVGVAGNDIITTEAWIGKTVVVSYKQTNKRWDVVYIDLNNQIKIMEGITSNSPTVPDMSKVQYKYILGKIFINPFYMKTVNNVATIMAVAEFQKNGSSLRTIYTDGNNNLFVGGKSFDDLQIINMYEPATPKENELWYDSISNKLRVWKTIDGITSWQNVNDTSIIPVKEWFIWDPAHNPIDKQFFLFDHPGQLNLRFVPGKNELDILIDNSPLHSDQFQELTITDAKTNNALKQLLIQKGYTEEMINTMSEQYENIGVGFKLTSPLDKACYVEVRVNQRVNDNPLRNRFQRTATFIDENSFLYNSENGNVVTTRAPYKLSEGQLEVFIDGNRLSSGIDYTEGIDLEAGARIKGATSSQFLITKTILNNSRITYKIISSIYSYDHVENAMAGLGERMEAVELKAETSKTTVEQLASQTSTSLGNFQTSLAQNDIVHQGFMNKTEILNDSNMPASVLERLPIGFISTEITKSGNVLTLTGIELEDFILLFDTQGASGNTLLKREIDYTLQKNEGSADTILTFTNPALVADGHLLYMTGIKFAGKRGPQ